MVWRFLKHYGMSKAGEVLDEFATAVVKFDPAAASQAQIAAMETELNRLGNRLVEAEAELKREHQETQALKKTYDEYLQAAQLLETKLNSETDPTQSAAMEASFGKVVSELERMKSEIEREELEDQQVEAWRSELRSAFEELAGKIRSTQSDLKTARREVDMARLQNERAREQDRRAREAAGLSTSLSSLSVALQAMNQETSRVRSETEALKLKAGVLQSSPMNGDRNVAAVLAEVRGQSATDRRTLSKRLSVLGGHPGEVKLVANG